MSIEGSRLQGKSPRFPPPLKLFSFLALALVTDGGSELEQETNYKAAAQKKSESSSTCLMKARSEQRVVLKSMLILI
jgi:hypothetical protein